MHLTHIALITLLELYVCMSGMRMYMYEYMHVVYTMTIRIVQAVKREDTLLTIQTGIYMYMYIYTYMYMYVYDYGI